MKTAVLASAFGALLVASVSASSIHDRRHAHEAFHKKRAGAPSEVADNSSCVCTTYVTTITGEAKLYQPTSTSTQVSTVLVVPTPSSNASAPAVSSSDALPSSDVAASPSSSSSTTTPCPSLIASYSSSTTASATVPAPAPPSPEPSTSLETHPAPESSVSTLSSSSSSSSSVSPAPTIPTPMVTTCPTPGTYTIPANTLTLTSTVTVPGDTATVTYSPGTYTQTATTVTVTVTSQVVTCPYTTETPTSTSTSAAAPETHTPVQYVAPTSENHPAPAPSSSTESSPSVYVAPSLSSYAPASTPSSYTAQPAENDNEKWCMTYSPYTNGGGCKPANEQASDIADIAKKGFSSIRLYSTDCGGLQAVGDAAKQHGLKIVAGVYIDQSGVGKAGEQVQALISWGQFQLVEMIVLGNEAIFNKYVSASDLAAFISSSKQKLQAAGYNGPVTTTEPLNILQEVGSTLCSCLDVVSANIHPFFNKAVTAAEAGDFVAKQLELVSGICPGKTAYNLETGWPSQGNANGAAQPGKKEQEEAIKAIKASAGGKSVFFSYTDDMWKNAGEFGVEQHFGCSHLF